MIAVVEEQPYPAPNILRRTFVQDVRGNCWLVSTVRLIRELGSLPYETMVFPTTENMRNDWDGREVYSKRYEDPSEAYRGHPNAISLTRAGKFERKDEV